MLAPLPARSAIGYYLLGKYQRPPEIRQNKNQHILAENTVDLLYPNPGRECSGEKSSMHISVPLSSAGPPHRVPPWPFPQWTTWYILSHPYCVEGAQPRIRVWSAPTTGLLKEWISDSQRGVLTINYLHAMLSIICFLYSLKHYLLIPFPGASKLT